MRFVILESPYAGDVEKNVRYARACLKDCLNRKEAPFASHLLYTQVLNDSDIVERMLGIKAGLEIAAYAEATVVYQDLGISPGMQQGIMRATEQGRPVEFRVLKDWK